MLIGAIIPPLAADPVDPHPKANSLAPQPAGGRSFGAPIQAPILHRRHKQGTTAATPTKSVVATTTATKSKSTNGKKPAPRAVSKSTAKGVTEADRSLPPDPAYRPPAADSAQQH
ncbi:MAG TPA: hypothetical protein VNX02_17610 [Steroidobacteraceae bacterium]|nr:hypothetical protein [Steroidobacteraceae bacterium]